MDTSKQYKKDWIYPGKRTNETPTAKGEYNPGTGEFNYNPALPPWTAKTPALQHLFKPGKWEQFLCIMGNSYPSGEDALQTLGEGLNRIDPPKCELKGLLDNYPVEGAPPNWLVNEEFWIRGESWLLNAGTGAGKSTLLTNMMCYWACGKPWMGLKPNGPLQFLVCNGENMEWSTGRCVTLFLQASGLAQDAEAMAMINRNIKVLHTPDLMGPEFFLEVRKHLRDFDADVLVVDPLYSFVERIGGSEGMDSMRRFIRADVQSILKERGMGAIITHHFSKASMKDDDLEAFSGAGSSELANSARLVSNLRDVPEIEGANVQRLRWYKKMTRTDGSEGMYTNHIMLEKGTYDERVYKLHVSSDEAASGHIDLGKAGKIDIMDALTWLYTWVEKGHHPFWTQVRDEFRDRYDIGDTAARRLIGQLKRLGYLYRTELGRRAYMDLTPAGFKYIGVEALGYSGPKEWRAEDPLPADDVVDHKIGEDPY
jgi:hypothetical protein